MVKSTATTVMARAWSLFRTTYDYPHMPFASIGRKCFASCLRRAWAEARAAAELQAMAGDILQARVDRISVELEGLKYRGWGTNLIREHNRLNDELRPLAKELLRRSLAASLEAEQHPAPDLALAA